MITAVALGLTIGFRAQGTTAEYVFQNIKAAYFAVREWETLDRLVPGIVKSSSAAAPTGAQKWIWIDEKRNRFVIGSKDDTATMVAQYLKEFDVAPKPVRLTVRLARTDWGLETRSTIDTVNGSTARFGSDEMRVSVSVKSRINNDGTITLFLSPELEGAKKWQTVSRIQSGGRIVWQPGGVTVLGPNRPLTNQEPMFVNPSLPTWLQIEVKAEIP